jgi:hypothetical protein
MGGEREQQDWCGINVSKDFIDLSQAPNHSVRSSKPIRNWSFSRVISCTTSGNTVRRPTRLMALKLLRDGLPRAP